MRSSSLHMEIMKTKSLVIYLVSPSVSNEIVKDTNPSFPMVVTIELKNIYYTGRSF